MNKESYLALKKLRESESPRFKREDFCFSCERLRKNCLCPLITPFNTEIHYVLLMHPKEARKEKIGTGKISNLFLSNSKIITGVDFSENILVNQLLKDENNLCLLLYPGKTSLNVSKDDLIQFKEVKNKGQKIIIFILDGTWPCAKKMLRLSKNLLNLPRISFSPEMRSSFEIKEQPAEYCLSTLESIHCLIKELNHKEIEKTNHQEDQMLVVFKAMINFQIECSLNPELSSRKKTKLGYSKREDRITPKKWQTRNIFLSDTFKDKL